MPRSFHSGSYKQLIELLVAARKKVGLSQVELGERVGRPQTFISKIERGERRIDVIEFLILCDAIGTDPHQLLEDVRSVVRSKRL